MWQAPQELRTYFVTFSTANRRRLFQVHGNAELFIATLMHYRKQSRYTLHAYVVMPDHVHLLLTPAAEISLEKTIQFIRGGFSFRLRSKLDVWERGHFDKRLENGQNYHACVAYIEENPVKARLVTTTAEYPFSSAGREGLDPMPAWMRQPPRG